MDKIGRNGRENEGQMVRHGKACSVLRPKTSQSLLRPSQSFREGLISFTRCRDVDFSFGVF